MAAKFSKNSKSNWFSDPVGTEKADSFVYWATHQMFLRFLLHVILNTYIFISVIYLSIFYEIGLLTQNVIKYVSNIIIIITQSH